jgi:hypothetical protein
MDIRLVWRVGLAVAGSGGSVMIGRRWPGERRWEVVDVGFGYKTSWLAVRDRSASEVADALRLTKRASMTFKAGTELAYKIGVYVTPDLAGWTLAHGAQDLWAYLDATDPRFPARLVGLSTRLGEVQYFATHRVSEYHAWALARHGHLIRGYCYIGDSGTIPLFMGEPTPAEHATGVGTGRREDGWQTWTDAQSHAWLRTTPNESDVMQIAGHWSIGPDTVDDDTVSGTGIHGIPALG